MKRSLAGCAAILVCLALAPSAQAALRFKPCDEFECGRLTVPLDRSGEAPGRVSLFVKRSPGHPGRRRSPLVILNGDAGQATTNSSILDVYDADEIGNRDQIIFDQRGTGRSGLLRCRGLETADPLAPGEAALDCARSLGPRRAFYTADDTASDLDAIRSELGYHRLAFSAVSYGSKVALAYAALYPRRVDRLLLDSIVPPEGPDPLLRDSMVAARRLLPILCRSGCGGVTRGPVSDLEELVGRFQAGPLPGLTVDRTGRPRSSRLGRQGLLNGLLAGDQNPLVRVTFPVAVKSALAGDLAPILRLKRRVLFGRRIRPERSSAATLAAATCEETSFPWGRAESLADRRAEARRRVGSLSSSLWRPFDLEAVLGSRVFRLCERWPRPLRHVADRPLPNVPTLIISGEDDLHTPLAGAQRLASRLPRSVVITLRGVGHRAAESDFSSGCADDASQRFLNELSVPRGCEDAEPLSAAPSLDPPSVDDVPRVRGVAGLRGRVVGAALATVDDVLLDFYGNVSFGPDIFEAGKPRGLGLRGGRWAIVGRDFSLRLRRVVYVPGIRISGTLHEFDRGRLRISGSATPDGWIRIRGNRFSGRLGGRRFQGRAPKGLSQTSPDPANPILNDLEDDGAINGP